MKFNYLLCAMALILFSCESDDDQEVQNVPDSDNLVLIGNEGAFLGDNASLTLLDREAGVASQNAYYNSNVDAELGDVLQSMYEYNDELYLVVNNSGKIEVVDEDNLTSNRTITGFTSPRYMLFENNSKAYVSDLFANGIHVINPSNGTYTSLINTGFWVEHMIAYNGDIWCSAPGKDKVFFLDSSVDVITDSLQLTAGVSDMGFDANNDFWILSQGTYSETIIEPALHHVDGDTKELISTFSFPAGTGFGGNLTMSADKQSVLYLMGGKIYKMSISATSLPATAFIEKENTPFYTLSVNPENGEIAATYTPDFSQSGKVYFYGVDGAEVDNYTTGVAPKSVLWLED